MTPQERSLIDDLANKLAQTQVTQKDAEAEGLIQQEIGSRPDALYKLVQTVLVQNMAMEQARAQIAELQQKAAAAQAKPAGSTSFLGSLFGSHSNPAPSPQPQGPAAPRAYAAGPGQPPPPAYGAPGYAPPPGYAPATGGGGSSFLRSAATTAAGVAAGALAFEGIQALMHGGLGGGFGHSSGFMGGAGQPGETVINNYYDSPDDQASGTDVADDAGYTDDPVADAGSDDAGYDDVAVDDSGGYADDGGGDFGGGGDDLV